jgi:hypothetical protein
MLLKAKIQAEEEEDDEDDPEWNDIDVEQIKAPLPMKDGGMLTKIISPNPSS